MRPATPTECDVSGQRWISTKQSVSRRRFLTKRRSGSGRRRRGAGAGPRLLEQVRQQSRRSGADRTPMNSSLAGVSSSLASSMVTPTAFRPLLTTRSWSTTIAKTPSSSSITKASASSPRDRDFRKRPTAVFCVRKAAPSISTFSDYERHVVVESTLDGETVWTLNRRKDSGVYEKEEQFKPSNTVVAPNGDIYVADGYGLSYVHQFSPRLERIRPWAGKGSEAASSMARTASGSTDRSNTRLHTFTLSTASMSGLFACIKCVFPRRAPSAVSATIPVCGKSQAGRICLTLPGCLASSSGRTLPAEISAATSMRWSDSGGARHEAEEGVGRSGFQELSK